MKLCVFGVNVLGVVVYGVLECYCYGYVNNWMWFELRGESFEMM